MALMEIEDPIFVSAKSLKKLMNKEETFEELKQRVSNIDRYEDFIFLEKPIEFNKTNLFSDKYAEIQLHDVSKIPGWSDILGFCGVFKIENEKIKSLDYDSYDPEMIVVGYQEFIHDNETCLDLLTIGW
ncbi:hypothetical protein [Lachnospira multipara]|uniref:hypothetical protein n=1 Tax=Lachnospira multipara TaxID=28051 RepID=UPI00048231B5|nr:hypothetical protein [Lachnospira multipara]